MSGDAPYYGEVRHPGWLGKLLGRGPRIVREANSAAARAQMVAALSVVKTDPSGNWITYKTPDGVEMIRFRASAAWLVGEPTIGLNDSPRTKAIVLDDGRVVVHEGLHRTRAAARDRILIGEEFGGARGLPGWLDFRLGEGEPLPDSSSARAIAEMLGGDLNSPPVPAK